MAQLDRLLSVMVSNRADLLVLTENDVAKLQKGSSHHPVTKQTLNAPQLIALLRRYRREVNCRRNRAAICIRAE